MYEEPAHKLHTRKSIHTHEYTSFYWYSELWIAWPMVFYSPFHAKQQHRAWSLYTLSIAQQWISEAFVSDWMYVQCVSASQYIGWSVLHSVVLRALLKATSNNYTSIFMLMGSKDPVLSRNHVWIAFIFLWTLVRLFEHKALLEQQQTLDEKLLSTFRNACRFPNGELIEKLLHIIQFIYLSTSLVIYYNSGPSSNILLILYDIV